MSQKLENSPNKYTGGGISKRLLTPCRRVGLSRKRKTGSVITSVEMLLNKSGNPNSPIEPAQKETSSEQLKESATNRSLRSRGLTAEFVKDCEEVDESVNVALTAKINETMVNKNEKAKVEQNPSTTENAMIEICKNSLTPKDENQGSVVSEDNSKENVNTGQVAKENLNTIEIAKENLDAESEIIKDNKRKSKRGPKGKKKNKKGALEAPVLKIEAEDEEAFERPQKRARKLQRIISDELSDSKGMINREITSKGKSFEVENANLGRSEQSSELLEDIADDLDKDYLKNKKTIDLKVIKAEKEAGGKELKKCLSAIEPKIESLARKEFKKTSSDSKILFKKSRNSLSTKKSTQESDTDDEADFISNSPKIHHTPKRCVVVLSKLNEVASDSQETTSSSADELKRKILQLQENVLKKRKYLEDLKRANAYKKLHNVDELNSLTNKWQIGCVEALQDLLCSLNRHTPMTMSSLLKNLNIDSEFIQIECTPPEK